MPVYIFFKCHTLVTKYTISVDIVLDGLLFYGKRNDFESDLEK